MRKLALHWKILIGMVLGVVIGLIFAKLDWGPQFIKDWVKPFGQIFINLLKLIAIPLVIVSLAKGVTDLRDLAALSRIGGRTVLIYLMTTVTAVILGLFLVNYFQPGSNVSQETLTELSRDYTSAMSERLNVVESQERKGPLSFLVGLVPANVAGAAGNNANMLQIIFVTVFFSISLLLLPADRQKPMKKLIDAGNVVMMKTVDIIMLFAPYAVLALLASLIVETTNGELFVALLSYSALLMFGMLILVLLYALIVKLFTKKPFGFFLKGMFPAQLVALSTSSSMATLPVTMECVEDNLGVEKEISSFVCPVGATINMDGSSLMQAIAAVFVCQVLGHDLSITDQLTIVLTGTLASIGAAAAPSAGIIMLVIVLESVGFPSEKLAVALAMILSVDRPLDMGRTVVNISGDGFVSVLVARSLGKLKKIKA